MSSSIEEQLARDIAAVTKGVIVTEPELLDARISLDDRIESKHVRDRRRTVVAVAAATAVIAGAGAIAFQTVGGDGESLAPANPSPSVSDPYADYLVGALPTPALIDGFWRLDNGGVSMLFEEDGTVQIDEQGSVYSDPAAWGAYEISGDSITMTMTGGEACAGTQFEIRASLLKIGNMRTVGEYVPGDGCSPLPHSQVEWEHVLPTSGPFADTVFSSDRGWQPLKGQALIGDWAAEGADFVLEMTPNGAYYILDESAEPIDQGQWLLQGSDLSLTSSAGSIGCNKGDRLVLGNGQTLNAGTTAIRGTVEENACDGTWMPKTWFLIPNAGS